MSWASKLAKPYRIEHGKTFRLKDFDPADTGNLDSKEHAVELLEKGIARMEELQNKLYAQDNWALLLVFQAMDAAGKDGAIKHVMSGVNPQGCQVYSFKSRPRKNSNHDFLWRDHAMRAGAWTDRYLQPLLLRGSAGRPSPSGSVEEGASPAFAYWARTFGKNGLKTSAPSNAILPVMESSSLNFS